MSRVQPNAPQGHVLGQRYEAVKDSGARQDFDTGARRDTQDDKPRYGLVSIPALTRLAWHYTNGAKKYGENNWTKGMPYSRFFESTFRHLAAWATGDESEDHLAAVAWNAFAIMHFQETGRDLELNDMFAYTAQDQIPSNQKKVVDDPVTTILSPPAGVGG